jgi:hypothetical protein
MTAELKNFKVAGQRPISCLNPPSICGKPEFEYGKYISTAAG